MVLKNRTVAQVQLRVGFSTAGDRRLAVISRGSVRPVRHRAPSWYFYERSLDYHPPPTEHAERHVKSCLVLSLMTVAAFCAFGFVATFEPIERGLQIMWRALYTTGALASLAGVGWVLTSGRRKS